MIDVLVTTKHYYSVPFGAGRQGYCADVGRKWFAAHGLSWADFVREGLPASVFEETGDPLALKLVEHARKMEAAHG